MQGQGVLVFVSGGSKISNMNKDNNRRLVESINTYYNTPFAYFLRNTSTGTGSRAYFDITAPPLGVGCTISGIHHDISSFLPREQMRRCIILIMIMIVIDDALRSD